MHITSFFLFTSLFVFMAKPACSETLWLPKKLAVSPLSTTFIDDPYTGVAITSDVHLMGNVSTNFPVLEFDAKSQLVASAQVIFVTRYTGPTIYAETLDAKVSFYYLKPLDNHFVLRAGFTHASGHAMDDIKEKFLLPLNMGSDNINFRLAYDGANPFRYGIDLHLFLGSEPVARTLTGGLFGEYYFSQNDEDSFYIAQNISMPESLRIGVGTNSQLGYAYKSVKIFTGYAQGADPRLKHQLYMNLKAYYYYGGLRIEI